MMREQRWINGHEMHATTSTDHLGRQIILIDHKTAQAMIRERKANWHEIPGVGHGYAKVKHPGWDLIPAISNELTHLVFDETQHAQWIANNRQGPSGCVMTGCLTRKPGGWEVSG